MNKAWHVLNEDRSVVYSSYDLVDMLANALDEIEGLLATTLDVIYDDNSGYDLPYCGDVSVGTAIVACFCAKGYSYWKLCTDVAESIEYDVRSFDEGQEYELGMGYTVSWKRE